MLKEIQKINREKVIQSAQAEKQYIQRRKSVQIISRNEEVAIAIKERMKEKKEKQEIQRAEQKHKTRQFLARAKMLNQFKVKRFEGSPHQSTDLLYMKKGVKYHQVTGKNSALSSEQR